MARKLILPAEIKVCATCSFWDGDRKVDPELRVVVICEKCEGECMVTASSRHGLHDTRAEPDCAWEHLAPDDPEHPEDEAAADGDPSGKP